MYIPLTMRTLDMSAPLAVLLLSLLLSTAAADPDCGSVCVYSKAGFVAAFRTKTNGAETDLSGEKAIRNYACWETNDLQAKGFQDGASCWVSTDIVLGLTNHQAGANFNFRPGSGKCYYTISGTTLFPSFSGVYYCADTFALNDNFGGRPNLCQPDRK